jgi:hypothetical protein
VENLYFCIDIEKVSLHSIAPKLQILQEIGVLVEARYVFSRRLRESAKSKY